MILTQKIWLSAWLIASVIGFVGSLEDKIDFRSYVFENTYDRHARTSVSIESKTLCKRRICIGEYLNSEIE